MANKQLKGIKVNGTPYDINATSIGTHLTDNTGKDYILGVKEDGKLFTRDEENNEVVAGTGSGTGVGITPEQAADIEQAKSDAAAAKATADSIAGTATEAKSIAEAVQSAITAAGITVKVEETVEGSELELSATDKTCKLYINSFYCGCGLNGESEGYCSHNFVELSNLTDKDIKLDGISLQYLYKGQYAVLPLKGTIRQGGTFLIRGAEASAIQNKVPRIIVEEPDMEWRVDSQLSAVTSGGTLISFGNLSEEEQKELTDVKPGISFVLVKTTEKLDPNTNPWGLSGKTNDRRADYIDSIGLNNTIAKESDTYAGGNVLDMRKRIFRKYYAMDPVSQATKDFDARKNSALVMHVDISKENGERIPNVEVYAPKSSKSKKDIFYNKTQLLEEKPTIITCSFGIQATHDDINDKKATRCFNWVSKGVFNEYIWIRKQGDTSWGEAHESINGLNQPGNSIADDVDAYNNRIIRTYSDGIIFTAHKYIARGLEGGVYEYIAGHKDRKGNPIIDKCTDIRTFTVRKNSEISEGFSFVQTSDQQGFNWEEYRLWEAASKTITDEGKDAEGNQSIHFMVNTGDMTQSGNRMGEWLDYFNAKSEDMQNMEEMATVGNNDLSPANLRELCNGTDGSKINHANYTFFYTCEVDEQNPQIAEINGEYYFIPSLYSFNYGNAHFICVNSEIKKSTEQSVYGFSEFGHFYPFIKSWCEKDINLYGKESRWNIAYCHELPFHILTSAVTRNIEAGSVAEDKDHSGKDSTGKRGMGREGASISLNMPENEQYWFSEFCQKHNIRLVIGGHKHTQSTTWPLLETVKYSGETRNVRSFMPTIVVDKDTLRDVYSGSTALTQVGEYFYPSSWVNDGAIVTTDDINLKAQMCTFKLIDDLAEDEVPVVYAMSQATGYKHTSNKELPGDDSKGNAFIPWIQYGYPCTSAVKANGGQKYPFYTIWDIKDEEIRGNVRYVDGAFDGTKGTFDINSQGDKLALHQSTTSGATAGTIIHSVNPIKKMKCAVNSGYPDTQEAIILKYNIKPVTSEEEQTTE